MWTDMIVKGYALHKELICSCKDQAVVLDCVKTTNKSKALIKNLIAHISWLFYTDH